MIAGLVIVWPSLSRRRTRRVLGSVSEVIVSRPWLQSTLASGERSRRERHTSSEPPPDLTETVIGHGGLGSTGGSNVAVKLSPAAVRPRASVTDPFFGRSKGGSSGSGGMPNAEWRLRPRAC